MTRVSQVRRHKQHKRYSKLFTRALPLDRYVSRAFMKKVTGRVGQTKVTAEGLTVLNRCMSFDFDAIIALALGRSDVAGRPRLECDFVCAACKELGVPVPQVSR
jgi:hypothetical protein